MKPAILSHTVYTIYWRKNRQLATPNEDIIKLFLISAKERGENLSLYHIASNVAPAYDIQSFLDGKELPQCWQVS